MEFPVFCFMNTSEFGKTIIFSINGVPCFLFHRPCPPGYYCVENSTHYLGAPCPVGHICPEGTGSAAEHPCPKGTYNNETGKGLEADCIPCDPGYYCHESGRTYPTGTCDPGWYCSRGAWSPTPADYANETLEDSCVCPPAANRTGGKCAPGEYCPGGSSAPLPCTPGKWKETATFYHGFWLAGSTAASQSEAMLENDHPLVAVLTGDQVINANTCGPFY